jgi:hypothetical protein
MRRTCFAIAATLLLTSPVTVLAQTVASERWFVSVNGAYRVDAQDFRDGATFLVSAEEGRFDSDYTVKSGPMIDVAGGVLIRPRIGVGVGVSHYRRSTPAALVASVPHPFFFDRPRAVSGEVSGLTREELGVHVQARGVFPVGQKLAITLFGGPSYFGVSQDVVTQLVYADAYPFDEASFRSAGTASGSQSALGVNAGGDVAVFVTPRAGIGFSVQFAGANVDLPSANAGSTRVRAGGVSTGAGLRLRF